MSDLSFRQEYLGQFVSWEGSIFRNIDAAVSSDIQDELRNLSQWAVWAMGVDWGRTNDPTVITALAGTEKLWIARNRLCASLKKSKTPKGSSQLRSTRP